MIGTLFRFTTYTWSKDRREITCNYELISDKKYMFSEKLLFPCKVPDNKETAALSKALHLALGISYYKLTIPPKLEYTYSMTEKEADFWNTVYTKGLGEFLYSNKINPSKIARFSKSVNAEDTTSKKSDWYPANKALLGIGGGKDSIVAKEILKSAGITTDGFILISQKNKISLLNDVTNAMEIGTTHYVLRHLDNKLIELQKNADTYKGHVPISLIFALVGCLLAVANNSSYVAVGNESSSSIPQAQWKGMSVNHQWSKSIEFEKLFQSYLHDHVSDRLHYFSVIRPLNSTSVMKLFSSYPHYFPVFTSDNSIFRTKGQLNETKKWTKQSSKTLSTYILMSPWVDAENLLRIFEEDLSNDESIIPLAQRLLGDGKPVLDCVGTPDELKASLREGVKKGTISSSSILAKECLPLANSAHSMDEILSIQGDHAYPVELAKKLCELIKKDNDNEI